jgi:hypothetical protein
MSPFQGANELEVFANLDVVDLESKSFEKPSFFEQVEQERELYMLAVIDEETGNPVRPATEEELHELLPLELVEPLTCSKTKVQTKVAKSKEPIKTTSLQELLAAARNGAGPMCDHCGATGKQEQFCRELVGGWCEQISQGDPLTSKHTSG